MRKYLLPVLAFLLFLRTNISAQTFNFGQRHGGTGSDITRATTTDAQNNYYSLVFYYNNLTIDSAGTPKTLGNYGNRDIAILKYDCNKIFQWAIRVGSSLKDGGDFNNSDLIVDTLGNLYVTSTFNGTANFVSSNGIALSKVSFGGYDGFVLKANNAGVIQWINQMGSAAGNDESEGIALDRDGNVYLTGLFYANGIFTSTSGPNQNRLSFGSSDIFIAKYNPAGLLQYVNRGGANLQDNGIGIGVDSLNAVYVAGGWGCCGNSTAPFGANNITNTGNWGAFIAKADASGNWLWANNAGTNNFEAFADVVVDDVYDRVYVIGHFNGPTTISTRPGGTAVPVATNGNYDAMIASMDFNGALQWGRAFGSTSIEYGLGVALDLNRNPVFTGEFNGTTNFGGITLSPTYISGAYYAKYSPANVLMDAQKVGTDTTGTGFDIHTSTAGHTYVSGYFTGTSVVGTTSLVSAGAEDGFVARIDNMDTTYIGATKTSLSCTGDSAVLYIPNKRIGKFSWLRNDTLITGTNGNLIKTLLPGIYKVIAENFCAPADTSATLTITKSLYYTVPAISDIKICTGDSAQFSAAGGTTYRWSPAMGLSDTAIANPFVKPTGNTNYLLTIRQGVCTAFDTIGVSIQNNCCLTCSTPYSLNEGVVACFPFTGNANDESGKNNNATVFNAALTTDRFGTANRAYQFNGFNSYLEVPNSASLSSPSKNISFTFWAQINNWNFNGGITYTPILSKSTNTAGAQYRAMIRSDGAYAMADGQSWNAVIGTTTNLTTWYFFAITVSNDTIRYYRNGVLLGFVKGNTTITLANTTPLRLGRNDVNTLSLFNGRLDEVRIYGRTINTTEVLKLYNLSVINGLPPLNAGTDKNICVGDSAYISPVGANGTFLWTPARGLNDSSLRNVYAHPDTTTIYIVKLDVSGCMNRDTIIVNTVRLQPYAGIDQSICLGDTASLTVLNGGTTFAWTPAYNIIAPASATPKVFPKADTNYVVITSNGLCSKRDTVRIAVKIPIINAGTDKDLCKRDTAFFNITTNGTARWSPLTYLSDSVGNNVYSVADTNITYIVTTNYLGCFAKDTVKVTVISLPIDGGPDQSICFGDSVQLHATGGGSNYIWIPSYKINDTTSANPWVKPLVPTKYYVVSYNLVCARFDSVNVDVKNAAANAGRDTTICNKDSTQLKATVIGPYRWSPMATLSDTSLQPYAKPLATTEYILTVNNGGCMAADTVKVGITIFNLSAGADKIICKGDSVLLTATGATKFNWLPLYNISDTGIYNPYVKPAAKTNYYVTASNTLCIRVDTVLVDVNTLIANAGSDTNMCVGQNIILKPNGGTTYLWLTSYNINNQGIANPTVTPAIDTSYIVKIGNGGVCYVYDTVQVEVNKYPVVKAGLDLRHCPGQLVQILASVTDYTSLAWSPSSGLNDKLAMQPFASVTAKSTYVLSALNGYCYSSDTVVVTPNPKVTAFFTPTPDNGAIPLPVKFINKSTNAHFYSWTFGEGLSAVNDFEPTYTYLKEGTYLITLFVQDSLGCKDSFATSISLIAVEHIFAPSAFTPNKDDNNDEFRLVYNPAQFEYVEYEIFNRWGIKIYTTHIPGGSWWNGTTNGQPDAMDTYSYIAYAKDHKGKIFKLDGIVSLIR
ncbi:MAG: gliding motility-associated C-terminal domain-containing protein [Bacteroidia bacterium]|nr:gliding motility-associated C-terminal domain-containing protein [Bacteroidia bacterium]